MKNLFTIGYQAFAILVVLLTACQKDTGIEKIPELVILPKPLKGLTTDVFDIKIEPMTKVSAGQTLFYRWDWNNDGEWDTPFSSSNQLSHRFFQPGTQVINAECSDGKKQVKKETFTIEIAQGYSAPHPVFKINPVKGNIMTSFTFDASLTQDDEDSLNQLKFRWDFLGDGNWTTGYTNNPIASYKYQMAGTYNPKLEARDPSGRSATFFGEITVDMVDTLIIASFTINKTRFQQGDTVLLDASLSYYSKDPRRELLYAWYLPDRSEWTLPDTVKMRSAIINQEGQFSIKLKVIDRTNNLYNQIAKDFFAGEQDLPPISRIQVGSSFGNIVTNFYMDAWLSTDDNQAPSELQVRWDFDGDGAWDTPFSLNKVMFHQFEKSGDYTVVLQVKDNAGLSSIDNHILHVSPFNNETGYFKDPRDGNFYGTVQVGNQWWMSENLNYEIPQKKKEGVLQWLCLFEQSHWCEQVGKIYRIGAVVENRSDPEYVPVCPNGWRVPSKEDWENLFSSIGGEQNVKELRYSGKADFNALDLGYGDYYFILKNGIPVDTIYEFHETFQKAWFLSTSGPYDPNHVRTDIWQWSVDKSGNPWVGYGSALLYMPVRCVKVD